MIASAMRNLARHRVSELAEGFTWEQWQIIQLRELNKYAQTNVVKYGKQYSQLNAQVEELIRQEWRKGYGVVSSEAARAKRGGWKPKATAAAVGAGTLTVSATSDILGVNSARLDALVRATTNDLTKAQYATLRQATDQYRSIIFDAQVYAASGAGTYEKAIDMATKDYLKNGIKSIRYRNGAVHTMPDYASMVIRTSTKRAGLAAGGQARDDLDVHTVVIDHRDDACPVCMTWVGQVLVDNVYSSGTEKEAEELGYPLLSDAMDEGLFHPNCQDTMSTYFPGISAKPRAMTEQEKADGEAAEEVGQLAKTADRNEQRYERIAAYSLDEDNAARADAKAREWAERAEAAAVAEEQLRTA